VFGIVELEGRDRLQELESRIANDGVETGEWERFCAMYSEGPVAVSEVAVTETETEDEE
jgi:hypothetical protein